MPNKLVHAKRPVAPQLTASSVAGFRLREELGDSPPQPAKPLSDAETARMLRSLRGLTVAVYHGDEVATERLLDLTARCVQNLEYIWRRKPELLRRHARHEAGWPVFYFPHPTRMKQIRAMVEDLSVGRYNPLPYWRQETKTDLEDPITHVAVQLILYIANRLNTSLPRLSKATASQWRDTAEKVFKEAYPNPAGLRIFRDFKGRPGRSKNKRIIERIGRRILSLAPK
jgi:hypothetical protein